MLNIKINSLDEGKKYAKDLIESMEDYGYHKGFQECKQLHEQDYVKGHDDGFNIGIKYVKNAIEWFRNTYGTTYVLIDASSIDHLLKLFMEADNAGIDTSIKECQLIRSVKEATDEELEEIVKGETKC